ncbi:MAG: NYN domain-containing protein [Candidatus Diapherotrites archaeon]|nr:NYN domain-containing protein [Candidatus Diapherotrites archaeon]
MCGLEGAKRFRTYVYDADPYQNNPPTQDDRDQLSEKQRFFNWLEGLPSFTVRKGKCLKREFKQCHGYKVGHFLTPCWHITQKGVDVKFSVDLVSLAWDKRIDKAILVTGDSDFIPAIENAKDANMKAIIYFLRRGSTGINQGLYYLVDERHEFTRDFFSDCLIGQSTWKKNK